MDKFETFSGIAAPMPLVNIDTDMIIPKQFLKTIKRCRVRLQCSCGHGGAHPGE